MISFLSKLSFLSWPSQYVLKFLKQKDLFYWAEHFSHHLNETLKIILLLILIIKCLRQVVERPSFLETA